MSKRRPSGPTDPPVLPPAVRVMLPFEFAPKLAYYSSSDIAGTGIVTPRCWSCYGTVGLDGDPLVVLPVDSSADYNIFPDQAAMVARRYDYVETSDALQLLR